MKQCCEIYLPEVGDCYVHKYHGMPRMVAPRAMLVIATDKWI